MHLQFKPGIITGHYYVKKLKSELFLPILPIFVRYGAPLHTIRTTRSNGSRASSPGCREFPVPVSPEGEGPAPVGKGFFSTRSTSKGTPEAPRMLPCSVRCRDQAPPLGSWASPLRR